MEQQVYDSYARMGPSDSSSEHRNRKPAVHKYRQCDSQTSIYFFSTLIEMVEPLPSLLFVVQCHKRFTRF